MLTDIYVIFLSPSVQMLVQYLKFGYNCCLPHFFQYIIIHLFGAA
jgi:hypothetical protein